MHTCQKATHAHTLTSIRREMTSLCPWCHRNVAETVSFEKIPTETVHGSIFRISEFLRNTITVIDYDNEKKYNRYLFEGKEIFKEKRWVSRAFQGLESRKFI